MPRLRRRQHPWSLSLPDRSAIRTSRSHALSHTWTAGSRRAVLSLDAMPLDLPPWHLRVRVSDANQPSKVATSDVLVEEAAPLRVLFYEPRPSWIATFVRRAIEADERFVVSGLDYPSRGIRIASGDVASLDRTALRAVSAVVVGGLDRLTVADRDRLDWFVRERGGSLVLLPDARPGIAPWTEWLSGSTTREVLLERPSVLAVAPPLPAIQVSELLTFTGATVPGATVLARVAGSNEPVVVMSPHGAGRLHRVGRTRRVAIPERTRTRHSIGSGDLRSRAWRSRRRRPWTWRSRRQSPVQENRSASWPAFIAPRSAAGATGPLQVSAAARFGRAGSVMAGSGGGCLRRGLPADCPP